MAIIEPTMELMDKAWVYADQYDTPRDFIGFRCKLCRRLVGFENRGDTDRGFGFMRIAMGEHLKAHIRHGEIK